MTGSEGHLDSDEQSPLERGDLNVEFQYRLIEQLAETKRSSNEVLSFISDVVFRIDADQKILFLNKAWDTCLGIGVENSLGGRMTDHVFDEDRVGWNEIIIQADDSASEVSCAEPVIRFMDVDGAPRWMFVRVHKRLDGGQVVGSLEDVTVRRKLESELLQTQRLESIGRLAGGLAHDFNNSLTKILGSLNIAQRKIETGAVVTEELAVAVQACHQASAITKRMLTFSKGGEPVCRTEDLGQVVSEGVALALYGSSVRGHVLIEQDLPFVDIDVAQVHQVLNNLIINAEQAMVSNGGEIWVRVFADHFIPEGGRTTRPGVSVEIRDSGCGIPEEHLEHILEPYFTTKATGNGLGLTSVYWIIKRHSGVLDIKSRPGSGSTVRFTLPVSSSTCRHAENEEVLDPIASSEQARILVMDDNEQVRRTVASMLESLGHVVVQVAEGESCVEAYQASMIGGQLSRGFDLVLLDLTIAGGRDGLWTIEKLREIDPDVCAIVASGYSNDPVMSDHRRHGFQGMLQKPFTLDCLEGSLKELLC
jgi:signal transduction histidine kinase/ActR/RegA family two-component response regulator